VTPPRSLRIAFAAAAILVAAPLAALPGDPPADPYDRILEEFRKKVETSDVDRAVDAVQLLDPANERSMPELVRVLKARLWRVRGAGMEALAKVPAGPLRSEMRLHLVTDTDLWVREGMAYAMAIGPVPGDAEALIGAMDDKEWRVRRTTARALGEIVSKDGVARLVKAVEEEQDLRVMVWVRASLRGIAGTDMGRDPRRWREWWERHKDRPEWKKQGDEVKRSDFAGVPLETVTLDGPPVTDDERKRRANRPDLFVLAPFGWTHDWFRPYLDEAADFVRITYVTLPTIQEMTGASGYGPVVATYPVDRLSTALDALREKQGKERIVILADGPTAWIAEKYGLRYPKHTAGLVLVNGWLDSPAYVEALRRLYAQGNDSDRWAVSQLTGSGKNDAEEGRLLRRVFLTASLQEPRDSEAFRLWRDASHEAGFCTVPDLAFDRHTKVEIPTCFYFPDPDVQPFSGGTPDDLARIRQSFKKPTPVMAVMRDSRGFAHVEDPAEFLRVLKGFLTAAGILE
jgi:pimeloyl-ACP methyl ester carboxylesterase